jgi:DhnA family fructose-bisphosphate aldolase class Ia
VNNQKITIAIPADVPPSQHDTFRHHYNAITRSTGKLMLFACDQKIEHLNRDFYGSGIDPDDNNPEHLFKIASSGDIGAFATHLGLIAQYGNSYKNVNYIVKVNGKTDLVKTHQKDPLSRQLWSINQIIEFKKNSGFSICGVGYTLYPGSEFEPIMLQEAAQLIYDAHQVGLVTILWVYPRGKSVAHELAPDIIAGSAGLAASLGADFVKLNPPQTTRELSSLDALKIAVEAAGKTKVIMAGGSAQDPRNFLQELFDQMNSAGTSGNATGRNIHQRPLAKAIAMTQAISSLVFTQSSVDQAMNFIV